MSEWSDRAEETAKAKGLVVHWPEPNELFVDIDDAPSLTVFHANLPLLGVLVTGFRRTASPSGRADRWHVRVRLSRNVVNATERLLLQALLGSDRLHEGLSMAAAMRGVTAVTVFFEKPEFA